MARAARLETPASDRYILDSRGRSDLRLRIADLEATIVSLKQELAQVLHQKSEVEEEFQCSNEELRVANAELEVAASELEEANAQLRRSATEAKRALGDLQNLLNSTEIATVFLDDNLRMRGFTPAIRRIFNLMDRDIGRPLGDMASTVSLPTLIADAREVMRTLQPILREVHSKNGASVYELRIKLYRTVDNRVEGVTITFIDITEIKRAEKEARKGESRFRALAESMPHFVFQIAPDGRLEYASQQWFDYSGLTLEATRDGAWERIHHPDDLPQVLQATQQALETGVAYDIEARLLRASDGAYRWFRMKSAPVMDKGGRIMQWVLTATDIDDQKRAEAEAISRCEAEAANRAKSSFLAAMSHELRTPLNAIIGFSDIIRTRAFGDQAYDKYIEYAGDIYTSGRHLLDLVNDILDISKIEAGKLEIFPEPLDVRSLLKATSRTVRTQATSHALSIVTRVSDPPPLLYADERAVKQILLNLLSNAIKFTPKGGKITIAAGPAGKGISEICVVDTGVGISSDQIDRVLRPFERLHHSYAREINGTGLGLSVVKALAEVHGGSVQLESEVGLGTTVRVRFPIPDPSPIAMPVRRLLPRAPGQLPVE